jgi:hypothetical protein
MSKTSLNSLNFLYFTILTLKILRVQFYPLSLYILYLVGGASRIKKQRVGATKALTMTRKKVKLSWIVNDSARKASLKKRRIGLLKKVSELTTLCGVSAFAIIYSPDDEEAAVWPSHQEVQHLLERFQSVPEIEQCRKMMNQDSYLRERTTKFLEQLRKQQRKNKEMEMGHLMQQIHQGRKLDELEMSEMTSLAWFLEQKMKDGGKMVEYFPQNPLAPGSFPPPESAAPATEGKTIIEGYMWDQWFIDMVSQNENVAGTSSGIRSNMGLPPQPHACVGDPYGNLGGGGGGIEMGLPHGNYKGSEMGGPPYGSFGFNIGVSDIGLQPHGSFGGDVGLRAALSWEYECQCWCKRYRARHTSC